VARLRRVPPGRAGRLWLQHRLAVAERGAALLEQKLRILRTEADRLAVSSEATARAWEQASAEAAGWLVRAALLGGERAVQVAGEVPRAEVDVSWTWTMGVRHPDGAVCTVPAPAPGDLPAPNAAVAEARTAHRRALEAAVQHAVAEAATRLLRAEETATRRRLRAVQDRWLPLLRSALHESELALEEQEHADGIRLRWARDRTKGSQRVGPGRGSP
jgi:V/A-type H+/Na+-transporting ATPase subunit D